jgi:hypothetical protein
MIIVQLYGGLGNQLFQYAFGRALATKLDTNLKLDISSFHAASLHKYSLMHYHITEDVAGSKEVESMVPFHTLQQYLNRFLHVSFSRNLYLEKSYSFDPGTRFIKDNCLVRGCWQSEKYFMDIELTIRDAFQLKTPVSETGNQVKNQIDQSNAVSIHVRRGDYVNNPGTRKFHGICDLAYYSRAIDFIANRIHDPHFYVFSDDPAWCVANLQSEYPLTFVTHNDTARNYEDLFLMSRCKHNILANSTFSWWGGWLNNHPEKIIIAPAKWFNTQLYKTDTLLPWKWVKL